MSDQPNPLYDLQAAFRAQLAADTTLAQVPTMTEDPADANAAMLIQLYRGALPMTESGKTGVAMLITAPALAGDPANNTRVVKGEVTIRISIYEAPILNRAAQGGIGVTALDAVWRVMKAVQGWQMAPPASPPWRVTFVGSDETESKQSGVITLHQIDVTGNRVLG